MLLSRMVPDTSGRYKFRTLVRSRGFYGHLPKFYKCEPKEWEGTEYECEIHRPHWTVSYVGYLVYIGKRHRYTFWYMGNPYRHKIFERTKNYDAHVE